MMRQLRLQWLTKPPLRDTMCKDAYIVAVLADWPLGDHVATVLASSFGDASLYTTSTFGVIGGVTHEAARKAALDFVQCAGRHFSLASPTTDYSYPSRQHIRFFFVTFAGVRSVSFPVTAVQVQSSPAFDLFAHAQQVVTELRLVTQKQGGY